MATKGKSTTSAQTATGAGTAAARAATASARAAQGTGPVTGDQPDSQARDDAQSVAQSQTSSQGTGEQVTGDQVPQDQAPEDLKKKELIDRVVARAGVKKKDAKPVIEAMLTVLGESLTEGRDLTLQPLGKIRITQAKDRPNGKVLTARIRQSGPALQELAQAAATEDEISSKSPLAEDGEGR